jgi:hypothetical protein
MSVRHSIARTIALVVFAASLFAVAGPASAGDTRATVFIVHGVPGVKVDVCIGGLGEVTSKLAYAERDKGRFEAGTYKLKVRKASKGECKGDVVAKGSVTLAELANATLVVRPEGSKNTIARFANDVAPTAPGEIRLTAAHMMKGGPIDVWSNGAIEIADLARGDNETTTLTADVSYAVWGTKAGETAAVVGPRLIESTSEGQAFSFVMVGTKVANSRVVVFKQTVGMLPA